MLELLPFRFIFWFLIDPGCLAILRFGRIKAICFDFSDCFSWLWRLGNCFSLLGWARRFSLFLSRRGRRLLDQGIGTIFSPFELNFFASCSGDFYLIEEAVWSLGVIELSAGFSVLVMSFWYRIGSPWSFLGLRCCWNSKSSCPLYRSVNLWVAFEALTSCFLSISTETADLDSLFSSLVSVI